MYSNSTEPDSVLATAYPDHSQSIHYSRPTTIFAAVAASIFTVVGVTGSVGPLLNETKCHLVLFGLLIN